MVGMDRLNFEDLMLLGDNLSFLGVKTWKSGKPTGHETIYLVPYGFGCDMADQSTKWIVGGLQTGFWFT